MSLLALAPSDVNQVQTEQIMGETISNPFQYRFNSTGVLYEASAMSESTSPYWWLNSGGMLYIKNGTGRTAQDDLPENNTWNRLYSTSSYTDTDGGAHPQNLFRLVTKSKWKNIREQVYFKINEYNKSTSENRNASNGVLLFGRYLDSNNLYYIGVRVDGNVVIKKKRNGSYHTLAMKQVFPGTYNRDTNSNLIPTNKWMGIRADIKNDSYDNVVIKLYLDKENDSSWEYITEFTDKSGTSYGQTVNSRGFAGIRTDFMDVEFENFYIKEF